MKVLSRQSNSRKCIICGMENDRGLKAPFYNLEDGKTELEKVQENKLVR